MSSHRHYRPVGGLEELGDAIDLRVTVPSEPELELVAVDAGMTISPKQPGVGYSAVLVNRAQVRFEDLILATSIFLLALTVS